MASQDIEKTPAESVKLTSENSSQTDLFDIEGNDGALARKYRLVNNAIDEIGFTTYHLKLFFLTGMGYATDSQLLLLESSVRTYVNYQFGYKFPVSNEAMVWGGIAGACFWGYGADLIGRKTAFNISLLLSAIFIIITGAMNSMATYCLFVAFSSWAYGGNLVLDVANFMEVLPYKHQWLLTFFAFFWSIGQTVAVLIVWAFIPNFSCEGPDPEHCSSRDNRGWRYTYYVNGAIVLVLAVLRVTVIRLKESPKFLVANNRDAEAVEVLQGIAQKYNRCCSLTVEDLDACGDISANHGIQQDSSVVGVLKLIKSHLATLFENKKMIRSTVLLFTSWFFLGILYPIYYAFLPEYLATRGSGISPTSTYIVYRDNVISNVVSTAGPIIAGLLLYFFPILGRRGVLAIGAFLSCAFFFGYTAVKNHAGNVAMSSIVYAMLYIYYGCLYAYSPEIIPAQARGTGNACCIMITRFGQAIAPLIAYYSDTSSPAPLYVSGSLIAVNGIIALFFPFEPSKNRPS